MRVYRCYFLNERDRIEAYENIEADALQEAVDRAFALLAAQAPQGNRNLGWAEPALSRPEKTTWAVQDFYSRLKT